MALDTTTPRSRRTLLAATLGAVAATIAGAIGRPEAARAGTDGDVVLGAENVAGSSTVIRADIDGAALVGSNSEIGGVGIQAWGESIGLQAEVPGPPGNAIWAKAGWGDGGQGGAIRADGWVTINGNVELSRSGRAMVVRGSAHADVDLRSKGGLDNTPLCFANVMSYRPGSFVTMVRPNYPIRGKARIYLNKAATADTFVAWLVLN